MAQYVEKYYTMKYGSIKYSKTYHADKLCPLDSAVVETFSISNSNPDDVPLCLTMDEMKTVVKLLEPIHRFALARQKSLDDNPPPPGCDEIDGPYPKVLCSQRILIPYGGCAGILRAITWFFGRHVRLTLEAHHCSYADTTKLIPDSGVIFIGLDENLEMIKKIVDECDECKVYDL